MKYLIQLLFLNFKRLKLFPLKNLNSLNDKFE
jgi:hypothetical protein